jgi:bacterioferritin-associated ferredoxin
MRVKRQNSECGVCGETVNNTVAIELKNKTEFEMCPKCLVRAKEMLQPYDLYEVLGGNK